MMVSKNDYYYLNLVQFNDDIITEYFSEEITRDINNKETYILDSLKDYIEYPHLLHIGDYVKDIEFDNVDYEKYRYKLWNTYCVNDYFFKDLQLSYIEFQTDFYSDFHLKDDTETNEKLEGLFKHLFKNIDLLFRYRVTSYERKLNKFYDYLNNHYLGYTDENLNDFYLKFTRTINLALNYRGYGILFDDVHENYLEYYKDDYEENPQRYNNDIIRELGFLII